MMVDEKGPGRPGYLNSSFVLLWQGNFISATGTVVYGMALGFWVLAKTGSTTLMGLVSASVVIPKLVLGPFAGSIVDKSNKKTVLVVTDAMAGLAILVVAALALLGRLEVWEAVCAGAAVGAMETFAWPAARAALPMLVPEGQLGKANAAWSTAFSGSDILGRSIGGYLYQALGAPIVFLLNGLSYLHCAVSELFIRPMPPTSAGRRKESFPFRVAAGAKQVVAIRGLLPIFAIIASLNFFGFTVATLFMPFFMRMPGLGPGAYGLVMASSTCGLFVGQAFLSRFAIPAASRAAWFCASGVASNLFIVVFPLFGDVFALICVGFLSGLTAAAINIVLDTALMLAVPSDYRGRVFAFVGMVGGFLVPLAMISAGILAEGADTGMLISACGGILAILFAVSFASAPVRDFLASEGGTR